MKKIISLIMYLIFSLATSDGALAAILYVPTPSYPTIQAAINTASAGDTIQVAPGNYQELITMKNGVIIQGAGAGDDPAVYSIIDGNSEGTVLNATDVDSEAKIDGFKITGGRGIGEKGGGMHNFNSSPVVSNCIFSGNSTNLHGGGMLNLSGSSPTIINCIFSGNTADYHGGGIYNKWSSPSVTNCLFKKNVAGSGGGGIRNDSGSNPPVTNSTFWANEAAGDAGGISNYESSPTVINCILWGNTPAEITLGTAVTYSNVQGSYTGIGNINKDPLFVNPVAGDFHLQQGSPCIDSGNNSASSLPVYDFEGDDRIVDGDKDGTATVDMGADEFNKFTMAGSIFFPVKSKNGEISIIILSPDN